MAHKIKVRRGLKKDLPKLDHAELGFVTDTNNFVIGNNNRNAIFEACKIGDTLTTLRTDLDSTWLLANGSTFQYADFPELADITLGSAPSGAWTQNNQGSVNFTSIAYGNGYFVAVGDSGTLYYKANTPTGAWTQNNQGTENFTSIAYANGYFVAGTYSGTLYYKANTPTGAWTANRIGGVSNSVIYADGYWASVGSGSIAYKKGDSPDGAWTTEILSSSHNFKSITHGNGYWVVVANTSMMHYKKGDLSSGTWSGKLVYNNTVDLVFVTYTNGYFVTTGRGGMVHYASIPSETWNISRPFGAYQNTYFYSITYSFGYWIVVGASGQLYYQQGVLSGTWTQNNQGTVTLNSIVSESSYRIIVGVGGTLRYVTTEFKLPAISIGGYTYIKVKL